MTTPEHETSKRELLACAERPDGWVDDLTESTRQWASDLPMEVLVVALRGCREPLRLAGADSSSRSLARSILLALACKDPDLLDGLATGFEDLLPGRAATAAQPARPPQPSLAA